MSRLSVWARQLFRRAARPIPTTPPPTKTTSDRGKHFGCGGRLLTVHQLGWTETIDTSFWTDDQLECYELQLTAAYVHYLETDWFAAIKAAITGRDWHGLRCLANEADGRAKWLATRARATATKAVHHA